MKPTLIILGIVAYLAVGYAIAMWMGGDRSKLSPDVTYLDWLGILLWMLFWPLVPVFKIIGLLRGSNL